MFVSPLDYIQLNYNESFMTMVAFSKFITSQRGGQTLDLEDTDEFLHFLKLKQKTRHTYVCRRHGWNSEEDEW